MSIYDDFVKRSSDIKKLKNNLFETKTRFYTYVVMISVFDIFILPSISISIFLAITINALFLFLIIIQVIDWNKINKKINKALIDEAKKTVEDYFNSRTYKVNKEFEDLLNELKNQQYRRYNVPPPIIPTQKLENAYKLLKISQSDTVEKIKKVYKELAIRWHPDKWTTSTPENQKIAERNFKKLQEAYELIKKDKNIA